MSKWLSDEWFDETRALWSAQPVHPDLSARMQYEISGGPDGNFSYYWVIENGRLVDSGAGAIASPDVTITFTWDDALAVHRGDLDPNVAFMQGRMKVAGSMSVMMALLPATNTEEYRDLRQRVAAVTEF
jgi:putative sterol carrier protein